MPLWCNDSTAAFESARQGLIPWRGAKLDISMILITNYIQLSKSQRQQHLKLSEPCIERGGNSISCQALLAHILGTTIPSGCKINICHACNNASCTNPYHLYWGTSKENRNDRLQHEFNTLGKSVTIWDRTVQKYGIEKAIALNSIAAEKGRKTRKEKREAVKIYVDENRTID